MICGYRKLRMRRKKTQDEAEDEFRNDTLDFTGECGIILII